MFHQLSSRISTWLRQCHLSLDTRETMKSYIRGVYPENPSIGLGQAYLDGVLDANVLCQYRWVHEAMREGPVFLEAWRKATQELNHASKKRIYVPYDPLDIIDFCLASSGNSWGLGWSGTSSSALMNVINKVHMLDPSWLVDYLSVQTTDAPLHNLLYSDIVVSRWIIATFPEHVKSQTIPWTEWLEDTNPWLYKITYDVFELSPEKWHSTVELLAQWSPVVSSLNADASAQVLEAICLMGPNKKPTDIEYMARRGLYWQALSSDLPIELSTPLGAALGCSWPKMDVKAFNILKHFNPSTPEELFRIHASSKDDEKNKDDSWLDIASGTLFLYQDPQKWCYAMALAWNVPNSISAQPLTLPNSFSMD